MKAIQKSLLAIVLAGAFTNANAIPVDWTLNANFVTIDNKKFTISGTFTFDADTSTFSNVSLLGPDFYGNSIAYTLKNAGNSAWGLALGGGYSTAVISFSQLTNTATQANITGGNINSSFRFSTGSLVKTVPVKATAVPEPEAYAMMLAGLGLVGFAARRKLS